MTDSYVKLKKDVMTNFINNTTAVFFYKKAFKLHLEQNIKLVLAKLKKGCFRDEIESLIGSEYTDNLVEVLDSKNMLTTMSSNNYLNTINEKQVYYLEQFGSEANKLQNKICSKTVAILGLGGLGGNVLQNLISSGVKNFILIDYDVISISNLNRQYIYNTESVGSLKISESKKYILSIDNSSSVTTYNSKVSTVDDLNSLNLPTEKIDIFINAADSPNNIQQITYEFSKKHNIPYITGGLYLNSGSWGPFFTQESYKKGVSFPRKDKRILQNEISQTITGSYGPTNNIISSYLANDILMFFINETVLSLNKTVTINFSNLSYKYSEYCD